VSLVKTNYRPTASASDLAANPNYCPSPSTQPAAQATAEKASGEEDELICICGKSFTHPLPMSKHVKHCPEAKAAGQPGV
jgi:hypothetical protein